MVFWVHLYYNLNKMYKRVLEEIKEKALADRVPIMEDEGMDFLLDFIKGKQIKSILEVGTAVAYSSLMMASVDPEINILTLELDENRYREAVNNIARCNMSERIIAVNTNAREYETDRTFDMIFLDGPKAHNQELMKRFEGNLRPDGYYVIDDVTFHGLVENPELIQSRRIKTLVRKIDGFVKWVSDNREYESTLHKVGDGVLVVRRKEQ